MRVAGDSTVQAVYMAGTIHDRVRHLRWFVLKIWINAIIGNAIASVLMGTIKYVNARVIFGEDTAVRANAQTMKVTLVIFAIALAGSFIAGRWLITRRMRWFLEGRPATASEQQVILRLPRLITVANGIVWIWIEVTYILYMAAVGLSLPPAMLAREIATHAYGFVFGTVLAFILVERFFRPYLRLILPAEPSRWPRSMGLTPRLLLIWFTVAGAPLVFVTLTWIGFTARERELAASSLRITTGLSAVIGLLAFVIAGRTLTVPLKKLESALRRVATGDLSPRVEINDAGEIGRLEAGFNDMVSKLRSQVAELRESRARIVEATDAERVRIERNLHDGAQQRLVSLAFAVRSAQRRLNDPELDRISRELDAAMAELRELARGIHPAILEDEGLAPALGSLAERATIPTEIETSLNGRLPRPVEITAYFIVAEALTNVARYADATRATVEATVTEDALRVNVRDDGKGGADPARGSGLRGLADRVAALGGEFTVQSSIGDGTCIEAVIPCR